MATPSHDVGNNNRHRTALRIRYEPYVDERQLPDMVRLIEKDLSEPYSVYTYRFFLHTWPDLCFLARDTLADDAIVGVIICKLDRHRPRSMPAVDDTELPMRGYIAMLAVHDEFRGCGIGSTLVRMAVEAMRAKDGDEVVLETEITNKGALHLYQNLGFVRDKRLARYYLNGVDAFRLKLWLK